LGAAADSRFRVALFGRPREAWRQGTVKMTCGATRSSAALPQKPKIIFLFFTNAALIAQAVRLKNDHCRQVLAALCRLPEHAPRQKRQSLQVEI
jgi:hypothetical protein